MHTYISVFRQLLLYALYFGLCSGLLLYGHFSVAQDFNAYIRIRAEGAIPEDFLLSSSEKFKQAVQSIEQQEEKVTRKAKEDFYEESSFYINELLLSGKVLFNDPASKYIAEVGHYLTKDQPTLEGKLRFYIVQSPSVNAFATNNGLILVNMGLLAKLENEAQLAFVLCHEISHYIKQHPIDIFLEARAIEKSSGNLFRPASLDEMLLAKNNYTQEKEQEADLCGLDLFMETDYSLEVIGSVFDILKYAHLPFSNEVFEKEFFETDYLQFPDEYFLAETSPIKGEYEEFETERHSHPSPDARKAIVLEKINTDTTSGRLYILGKDRFKKIREICRFESCFLHLLDQEYEIAIYKAYLLLQTHPNSFYLQKIISHALYGLSKYANAGKFWDLHFPYDEIEGNAQQLYHFLEKLQDDELNVLALTYHWQLYQQKREDIELELMFEDLLLEFGKHYTMDTSFFFTTVPISDSLRADAEGEDLFIRYALVDMMADPLFKSLFLAKMEEAHAYLLAKESERNTSIKPNRRASKEEDLEELRGFNLGLEKVVFVEPFYQRIDNREKRNQYLGIENQENKFIHLIATHADKLNLPYRILSSKQLEKDDVEIFNDLNLLSEWVSEKTQHEELALVSINHEEIQYLSQKYGTQHFVWTGALALTRPRTGKLLVLSAGFLLPILLPYAIYYATTPSHDTLHFSMIYDIQVGQLILRNPKFIRMKDRNDVMSSIIYDLILQIKSDQ